MRGWERVEVRGGWVAFGKDLAMRADLVQRVDVTRQVSGEGTWFRLEVKDAARAAPFVVFEGSEGECRGRLARLVEGLRGGGEAVPFLPEGLGGE
jgi:hypothetical protein